MNKQKKELILPIKKEDIPEELDIELEEIIKELNECFDPMLVSRVVITKSEPKKRKKAEKKRAFIIGIG